jgi:hypothetical protein
MVYSFTVLTLSCLWMCALKACKLFGGFNWFNSLPRCAWSTREPVSPTESPYPTYWKGRRWCRFADQRFSVLASIEVFASHVLRLRAGHYTILCNHLDSFPVDEYRLHFPACFQVPLTYFHIHMTFSFRSPPRASSPRLVVWRPWLFDICLWHSQAGIWLGYEVDLTDVGDSRIGQRPIPLSWTMH